jgi:hypothetical protein
VNCKIYAVALVAMSLNSFGQAGIIIRGGLNLANVSMSPEPPSSVDKNARIGFNCALMGDFPINPFNETIHAIIGGGFENKGATLSAYGYKDEAIINYLVVPVLLSIRTLPSAFANGPGALFFVNAGFEPSFLLSATQKYTTDGATESMNESSNTSAFDLGVTGELGVEFPFSPSTAGIFGLGYSFGLINFNTNPESDMTDHNTVIKIFTGFKFGLRR